ncbi:PrgI family protein [Candidatus Shapirobacteria bacterium]|nr:PrgI family protein [Candidatus Shapirobacteria bacterium]
MEQHPIPQHISSYEFRLIGEMTLGQFARVAGGVIVALIFYALPLPGFIGWFLVLLSAGLGIAFAFLPVEGRPLEVWLLAFLRSIYSPTQYVWRKVVASFDFQTQTPSPEETVPAISASKTLTPQELALLRTFGQKDTEFYSEEEIKKAQAFLALYQQPANATPSPSSLTDIKKEEKAKEARFEEGLPFPAPPDEPNIIVGMVIDKNGKIVEGAIIEIKSREGETVRAMRSNKLGQFRTISPLVNGEYRISCEKEGLNFDIMKIKLEGKILPPVEIREKGPKTTNNTQEE